MIDPKDITQNISELHTLRDLVQAYEEIASLRMKKTRDSVLYNRSYLSKIDEVFQEVRTSHAHEARSFLKFRGKKQSEKLTFLAHNGKTVAVFLSANTGLYGQIIRDTFNRFLAEVKQGQVEVAIIGKHGLSLFLSALPDHPYTYFDLSDADPKADELLEIIKHVVRYEEIHVYYGKFVNFIKQTPSMLSVSADISFDKSQQPKRISYLFEPSLEQILIFFETEIFASLFEQTTRESSLAKNASRAISMDKADQNIAEKLSRLELEKLKAAHHLANRKQLNSLPRLYLTNFNYHGHQ